jgi:aminoglycoside/choline kinase family phosphotransferase
VDLTSDNRLTQLHQWIGGQFGQVRPVLKMVSGDASFRRYFRFKHQGKTLIAVDAPSDKEDSQLFVSISRAYAKQGIIVPEVIDTDFEQGFMCLSDLGDALLWPALNANSVDDYYHKALALLTPIAAVQETGEGCLPLFHETLLRREMALFSDWFLPRHLNVSLNESQQAIIEATVQRLVDNALVQPQVGVHRDFHSRNLMITQDNGLAVIDYQDAVIGGVTYDAVSLLRDCYIRWPDALVYRHLLAFKQQIGQSVAGVGEASDDTFIRWFDLMGMQRHIKVCGIFTRLYYRDGKAGYLDDIPRVLDYVIDVGKKYSEFDDFTELMVTWVKPLLLAKAKELKA